MPRGRCQGASASAWCSPHHWAAPGPLSERRQCWRRLPGQCQPPQKCSLQAPARQGSVRRCPHIEQNKARASTSCRAGSAAAGRPRKNQRAGGYCCRCRCCCCCCCCCWLRPLLLPTCISVRIPVGIDLHLNCAVDHSHTADGWRAGRPAPTACREGTLVSWQRGWAQGLLEGEAGPAAQNACTKTGSLAGLKPVQRRSRWGVVNLYPARNAAPKLQHQAKLRK